MGYNFRLQIFDYLFDYSMEIENHFSVFSFQKQDKHGTMETGTEKVRKRTKRGSRGSKSKRRLKNQSVVCIQQYTSYLFKLILFKTTQDLMLQS